MFYTLGETHKTYFSVEDGFKSSTFGLRTQRTSTAAPR